MNFNTAFTPELLSKINFMAIAGQRVNNRANRFIVMKLDPAWENCIRYLNKEVADRTKNQGRHSLIESKITMNYIVSFS